MNYYLKATNRLYKSELRQIVHNNSAKNILSSCRGDILPAGMSVQAALDALRRGDLVLLRYKHLGAPLNGIFDINQEFASDLPETHRQIFENAGDAMPDISQVELDKKAREDEAVARAVEEANKCVFEQFYLSCKHNKTGRKYTLHVDAADNSKYTVGKGSILQVVGDDSIRVKYEARCLNGLPACKSLNVSRKVLYQDNSKPDTSYAVVKTMKKPGSFNVETEKGFFDRNEGLVNFLRYGLFPDLTEFVLSSYRFSNEGLSCDSSPKYAPSVEVFPVYNWKGAITLGMTIEIGTDKGSDFKWEIQPELEGQFGPKKIAYKTESLGIDEFFPSLGKKIGDFKKTMDGFRDTKLQGVKNIWGKVIQDPPETTMECEIKVAHIKIEGGYALKEQSKGPLVEFSREFALGFNPLISAEVKMDLIPAIVQRYAGKDMAEFIKKVLKKASEDGVGTKDVNVKAGISVILKMNGGIEGKLVWDTVEGTTKENARTVRKTSETSSASKEVTAKLTFSLEAEAFAEGKVFKIKAKAGFAVKATGAKEGSDGIGFIGTIKSSKAANGDPKLEKDLTFTGLAIVFSFYAQISKESDSSDNKGVKRNERGFGKARKLAEPKEVKEEESAKFVLLPCWSWSSDSSSDDASETDSLDNGEGSGGGNGQLFA